MNKYLTGPSRKKQLRLKRRPSRAEWRAFVLMTKYGIPIDEIRMALGLTMHQTTKRLSRLSRLERGSGCHSTHECRTPFQAAESPAPQSS